MPIAVADFGLYPAWYAGLVLTGRRMIRPGYHTLTPWPLGRPPAVAPAVCRGRPLWLETAAADDPTVSLLGFIDPDGGVVVS